MTVLTLTGGKKANLPALACLDSEHASYGAVIIVLKFNHQCKKGVGSHGSCSTETNADCVKMRIMGIRTESLLRMMEIVTNTQGWNHATVAVHENVVLEKSSKQCLTHVF